MTMEERQDRSPSPHNYSVCHQQEKMETYTEVRALYLVDKEKFIKQWSPSTPWPFFSLQH